MLKQTLLLALLGANLVLGDIEGVGECANKRKCKDCRCVQQCRDQLMSSCSSVHCEDDNGKPVASCDNEAKGIEGCEQGYFNSAESIVSYILKVLGPIHTYDFCNLLRFVLRFLLKFGDISSPSLHFSKNHLEKNIMIEIVVEMVCVSQVL